MNLILSQRDDGSFEIFDKEEEATIVFDEINGNGVKGGRLLLDDHNSDGFTSEVYLDESRVRALRDALTAALRKMK